MKGKGAASLYPRRSSAWHNIALLTVTAVLSQAIAFIYRILLSHMVGAEVLGLYQLVMSVYSVLLSLTSVGLTASVSCLSARFQAVGNRKAVWQLRNQAIRLFVMLAILPCALLLAFSDGVSVSILGDARTQLGLMLLVPCLLLTGVENLQKHYFYGTGFARPAALTELMEQLIRAVLVIGLLLLFLPCSAERIVGLIVVGMILCEVYSAVMQTVLFRRNLGPVHTLRGEGENPLDLRRKMVSIAFPVGATALLGNLLGSANSVLIPRLLMEGGMSLQEAMSTFGVTFGMTLPMLMLPTAFLGGLNLILSPKLAEASALGNRDLIKGRIRRAGTAANLVLIPSMALLVVLGPGLGSSLYRDVRVADNMELLAIGVLFSCWQMLLCNALSGLNFQASAAKITLFSDAIQLGRLFSPLEGRISG